MTRYVPQWLQSGTYAASLDRRLVGALWPAPASSGCAVTAAGVGMDVHVDPGQVAVPSPNGTGSVLCTSDAVETLSGSTGIAPAPPAGTDRVDLIVCQPRSIDLDGVSNQEDFIFAVVAGAEGAPPGAPPAVPAGTVVLAQVHVAGGSASLAAANITDRRPFGLSVAGAQALPPPLAAGAPVSSLTDADGEVWVAKGGVYGGVWKRARDVLSGRWFRAAALSVNGFMKIPLDGTTRDPYGMLNAGQVVVPVAGLYHVDGAVVLTSFSLATALTVQLRGTGRVGPAVNNYPSVATGQFWTPTVGDDFELPAGGYMELWGRTGGASNLGVNDTYMAVRYVGTG